ncbi:protein of unknown function (plasmid) [Cupriavidus neocaledonicus]|uniref:Uncharacterized protein n=1 Tax=Cupriavidus neocaledonicus TaxID=1040979 RepID=A0A375HSR4_9BURK|nr:hypothetical protein CBM2605_B10114 [Cupriavidus neocaledonicus]SPD61251.1 protein of unknown function [Cupriavidus neocaledonicus]
MRSIANLLIYKAPGARQKSSDPKCIAKCNADNFMRDGAGCTGPPARFRPYAALSRHRPAARWRKAQVGDYPPQRTITLHSPGTFHMLQLRSYKYLDQTSAESKALAT